MLYTSVLIQMWHGLAGAQVPAWSRSARAWRRSWLLGFATAVISRVRAAEHAAACQATAPAAAAGSRTALVLADRSLVIRRKVEQAYPVDPDREGHLQRQRLPGRLRQGPAGRHRRQPPPGWPGPRALQLIPLARADPLASALAAATPEYCA